MIQNKYISVAELNYYLSNQIQKDSFLQNVALIAEVSGVKEYNNTLYATLKDEKAQIQGIIFSYNNFKFIPKNGDKILAIGRVNYYYLKGNISFIIDSIQPYGLGQLHLQLEELKNRLLKEGVFDRKFKKILPKYPKKIGVVTSLQGAVIRDIITTIRQINNIIDITVIDTSVQGDAAPLEISNALLLADKQNFDAIILARGGGSFEDLMPFNSELVVRTIFELKTCFISAVGHETDTTLSDLVADKRAATPTAAAKMIAYSIPDYILELKNKVQNIQKTLNFSLYKQAQKFFSIKKEMEYVIKQFLSDLENKFSTCVTKLNLLNPDSILSKGYFKIHVDNKNNPKFKDLSVDQIINIYGIDSEMEAQITKITKRGEKYES